MSGQDELPKNKIMCICGVVSVAEICGDCGHCYSCCECDDKNPAWFCDCGCSEFRMTQSGFRQYSGEIDLDGKGGVWQDDGWEATYEDYWECSDCGRSAPGEAIVILERLH